MEIKTCEQYVLMQLSNKEKEVEALKNMMADNQASFNTAVNDLQVQLDAKEAIIQKCIDFIKTLKIRMARTEKDYIVSDYIEYIKDKKVQDYIRFLVEELHITIPGYVVEDYLVEEE